ncbi:ATP-binding cassette domain-containing protein [Desulfococcaceae bacterium HSG9]|nr:ATP-binding cassette domain-containing protein [Desulfococcaceae bacterium HSG9]
MKNGEVLLDIRNLTVEFNAGKGRKVCAVSDVSFQMAKGETLGLVGESGCGKSSLARAIIQLPRPASGQVNFNGEDLTAVCGKRLRRLRPRLQMIFQDSIAALNPRRKVGQTIAMPLNIIRKGRREDRIAMAREMMKAVGLDPQSSDRRPFEFSGGQCQRIQIARALMAEPELLICDEPVSSLDVSIQAQIINLLENQRTRRGLTMLFISHDMAVVKNVCDRVAVMYLGKLCEIAPAQDLYQTPAHPYTAALISAIPSPDAGLSQSRTHLKNAEIPSPLNPPSGCRFHTRCPRTRPLCYESEPVLRDNGQGKQVACHFPLRIDLNPKIKKLISRAGYRLGNSTLLLGLLSYCFSS